MQDIQQIQKIDKKTARPPMRWLRVPVAAAAMKDPELNEFLVGVREDVRALVGKHYYFIRVKGGCPNLCRVPLFSKGMVPHEIIDHQGHGISEEDLYHAIGIPGEGAPETGYSRISDHIEGKLRALLDA